MAKTKISEFSATPGNNTDIDGINIAEGCAPSGINDAIRELMSQLKDFQAGTAGDSFNGPVGTTTAAAGAFTTLSSTGNTTLGDASGDSVTINGNANFANVNPTLTAGTANGVAYLNGSKVLTTGSALTFDGTSFGVGTASLSALAQRTIDLNAASNSALVFKAADTTFAYLYADNTANEFRMYGGASKNLTFYANASEQMRLTSTGLGIGTSSPGAKLHVNGAVIVDSYMDFRNAGSAKGNIYVDASNMYINTQGTNTVLNGNGGNLGLGVTPSAWGTASSSKAMQIGTSLSFLSFGSGGEGAHIGGNTYWDGTNWRYLNTRGALRYELDNAGSSHKWYTAPSGTAGNAITFTQAMTLDASGNLGIGSTSPGSRLDVRTVSSAPIIRVTTNADGSGSAQGGLQWFETNSGAVSASITGIRGGGAYNQTNLVFSTADGGANTERARIDSSGNLLVGTTSQISNGLICASKSLFLNGPAISLKDSASTTGGDIIRFVDQANTTIGAINRNGASTVAYNTSSDYRLKDNIQPMTGALAKVAALKPCTYKWKADGSEGEGFIAHELAEVVPQCVTGEKDAVDAEGNPVYQGIDTSFLVATLTAAIQELKAEFDAYKASHP